MRVYVCVYGEKVDTRGSIYYEPAPVTVEEVGRRRKARGKGIKEARVKQNIQKQRPTVSKPQPKRKIEEEYRKEPA